MGFKPLRFFVLMALLTFVGFGIVAFFTQRAAHGHSADERSAYSLGERAGGEAPATARLPYPSDMNGMAQKAYDELNLKAEPMAWKTAYGHGYEEGFKKTHPGS